jgi:endoglucanase
MKKIYLKSNQSITFLMLLFSFFTGNTQQLTVSATGSKILKDGNPITLRGVNFGNWLLWEGYMMNMDVAGKKAHSQIRANIKDLLGNDEAKMVAFETNWKNSYITNDDFAQAKALGYNVVRIPFQYKMFWDETNGVVKNDGFTWLDKAVDWAKANSIYVIFDLHTTPGYQNPTYTCDNPGITVGFWSDWNNVTTVATIWGHIANHYKTYAGTEWIAGYDLINEPVLETNKANLLKSYKDITTQIRAVDTNHLIFAEGNYYGSDFYDMLERWDSNLVFSNHYYDQGQDEANPNPNLALIKGQGTNLEIPLFLGEFGENTQNWVVKSRIDYETTNIGWAFWAWKRQATPRAVYSFYTSTKWDAITNYINNGGTKPSLANVELGLTEICANTQLSNASLNTGLQNILIVKPTIGNVISMQYNSKYVSSNNSIGAVTATSATLGATENFVIVDAGDGKIALKDSNGNYMNAQNGTLPITSNSTVIGTSEKFEWIEVTSSQIALKGFNGKFVSSENGDPLGMKTRSETASGWEAFDWIIQGFLDIEDFNKPSNKVVFYPNPVDKSLSYTVPEGFEKHVITVFDATGKQLSTTKIETTNSENTFDMSDLSNGLYVLNINNGTSQKASVFIKK